MDIIIKQESPPPKRRWDSDGIAALIRERRWYDAGTMADYKTLMEYVDTHEMDTAAIMYVSANIVRRTTHDFTLTVFAIEDEIRNRFAKGVAQ